METARLLAERDFPVHRQVFLKICLELLKETFNSELSFKKKEILDGCLGIYGYEKKKPSEIGEQFNIKQDAVLKAKDHAVKNSPPCAGKVSSETGGSFTRR